MALNIKSEEADALARELAAETGETLTDAITKALSERLLRTRRNKTDIAARLHEIAAESSELTLLDERPSEGVIGYDEHGAFR